MKARWRMLISVAYEFGYIISGSTELRTFAELGLTER